MNRYPRILRREHEGLAPTATLPDKEASPPSKISLSGVPTLGAWETRPHVRHRIEALREDPGKALIFLTTYHGPETNTVAVIDKKGWQIQSFLKTLKQNLKIQSIVATSAHTLKAENWSSIVFALHYLCSYPPLRLELGQSGSLSTCKHLDPSQLDGPAQCPS